MSAASNAAPPSRSTAPPIASGSLPAQPLIQRLRSHVGHLGRKHKPRRTDAASIVGGRAEQRGARSAPACFWSHEQIIQDEDPRHSTGREARIKLSEPDGSGALEGKKDYRLAVLKAFQQEASCSLRLAGLTVELPIR